VKRPDASCWWCGKPTHKQELTELWNRRDKGQRRFVLLCGPCSENPNRTVWLRWKKEEHVVTGR
jgi:hypothetical protein